MNTSKLARPRSERPDASTNVNNSKPTASLPASFKESFNSADTPCSGRGLRTARCKRRLNQP